MNFTIREFHEPREHTDFERLQNRVWGDGAAVAATMSTAVGHHSGAVLGAFETETGRLVGGVVSFLCFTDRPDAQRGLAHHSHVAAVQPDLQGQGIGEALKRAQAEFVRAQGLNLITWTYDPMEARNAWLNIGKLGCVCRTFHTDYYGVMEDDLNRGVPSDRFEPEWWLDDAKPQPDLDAPVVEIEIPPDFQALKQADIAHALALRLGLRQRIETLFAEGYAVFGFNPDRARPRYVLRRVRG